MRMLEAREIAYVAHSFSPHVHSAQGVADEVGLPAAQVFKTLVAVPAKAPGEGVPLLAIVPGDRELDLKKLARASGEKRLRMASQREAESLTRLRVGGSLLSLCCTRALRCSWTPRRRSIRRSWLAPGSEVSTFRSRLMISSRSPARTCVPSRASRTVSRASPAWRLVPVAHCPYAPRRFARPATEPLLSARAGCAVRESGCHPLASWAGAPLWPDRTCRTLPGAGPARRPR